MSDVRHPWYKFETWKFNSLRLRRLDYAGDEYKTVNKKILYFNSLPLSCIWGSWNGVSKRDIFRPLLASRKRNNEHRVVLGGNCPDLISSSHHVYNQFAPHWRRNTNYLRPLYICLFSPQSLCNQNPMSMYEPLSLDLKGDQAHRGDSCIKNQFRDLSTTDPQ